MWQEFKKLGSACCTVRRREFIWGYDSGFGSAANFWHCSPLQPRPCRSNMCNTATDEKPILTTSFKTTQRGRAFSRSTFTPRPNVFKRGACYQKWSLSLQKKKKNSNRGFNYQMLRNKDVRVNDGDRNVAQWQHGREPLTVNTRYCWLKQLGSWVVLLDRHIYIHQQRHEQSPFTILIRHQSCKCRL